MPRVAGDNPDYTFRLCQTGAGGEVIRVTNDGFDLASVTTIISEVLAKPPQAMAWWGYRIAMKGIAGLVGTDALAQASTPEEVEAVVRSTGYDPNATLDDTRDRGSFAHEVLEFLAEGHRGWAEDCAIYEETWMGVKYCWAVIDWWDKQELGPPWASERRVWSLRHGYAGSLDLAVSHGDFGNEIIDLKTHKPASGFTKPGFGPAYISDLVQVRAYRIAWEEMGFGPTVGNRILIARENGKWLEDRREVPAELWFNILEAYRLKVAFENP